MIRFESQGHSYLFQMAIFILIIVANFKSTVKLLDMPVRKLSPINQQRGFSLIELLCVVAIIGILAVIGIPQYQKYRVKALQAEAKAHLAAIHTGESTFYLEHNGYHSSLRVIGFAPHGKSRYNVGFGFIGVLPGSVNFPFPLNSMNTKEMCSGAFGTGTDPSCTIPVDVPPIANSATVSIVAYAATAIAYEDMLMASLPNSSTSELIAQYLLGKVAIAAPPAAPLPVPTPGGAQGDLTSYDSWVIDQNNVLRKVRLVDAGAP